MCSILYLHNQSRPIELDPMFNIGSMYPAGVLPEKRFDISPRLPGVLPGDARNLPLADRCISSMVLDPPWLIHSAGSITPIAERFGFLQSKVALMDLVFDILKESARVLVEDGLLIFKCQDFIHDRRKFFMSLYVLNCALRHGFNPIDHVLLIAPTRMRKRSAGVLSYATHSWHTHFFVFRKKKSRTNYLCQ